jgi:hypothetical protein
MKESTKLAELSSSAESQTMYLDWLSSPITQTLLGAIREKGRPARPQVMATEASVSFDLGVSVGYNEAADLFETAARTTPIFKQQELRADYGATPRVAPSK